MIRLGSGRMALAAASIALVAAGCAAPSEAPEDRRRVTVGTHRVTFVMPAGMEMIDLGKTVELRSITPGPADAAHERITFDDLGPIRDRDGDVMDSAAVAPLGLDSLAEAALGRLDYDPSRIEIERRRTVHVGDRSAVLFDTWYRVTHQRYRRVVIVVRGNSLLAVQTQQGVWEAVGKRIEDLLPTVRFDP